MSSSSRSGTTTFTEARVREVMMPVFDDFTGCAARGFVSYATAQEWADDVTYLLSQQAISAFELQFTLPGGRLVGFRYEVSDDGSVFESSSSGGQKLHLLPAGTRAGLVVIYRGEVQTHVREEMRRRGWGPGATSLAGEAVRERVYSKDGYGVVRKKIGDW
jgi:hypothetical protein